MSDGKAVSKFKMDRLSDLESLHFHLARTTDFAERSSLQGGSVMSLWSKALLQLSQASIQLRLALTIDIEIPYSLDPSYP